MTTPKDIIQMIKNGGNPQQIMLSMFANNKNPVVQNLVELARKNDTAGIEKVARNLFKERGLDFDKEFNAFKQNFQGF